MGEITEALRRAERERELFRARARAGAIEPARAAAAAARAGGPMREAEAEEAAAPFEPGESEASLASGATVIPFPASAAVPAAAARLGLPKPAALVPIPRSRKGFWQPRLVALPRPGPVAEHYRHFAVRVSRELEQRQTNTVLITSAGPGEGKTTTAFNLALALASISAGRRVALVDLDLRHPSVARALELNVDGGIEAVLAGSAPLASVCARTDFPSLDVFLAGAASENAHELLVGDRLPAVVRELSAAYHVVVFDSPPVLPVPDAALIAAHVGGCVPVVRAGETRRTAFLEMLALLSPIQQIGHFLNFTPGGCSSMSPRRVRGNRAAAPKDHARH